MPRCFSSGALSISSKATAVPPPCSASTFVIAAVRVVLPWSMCPMVPTLTCGFVRSNFCLPMSLCLRRNDSNYGQLDGSAFRLGAHDRLRDRRGDILVAVELHGEGRATLRHRAQVGRVPEHLGERHARLDRLGVAERLEVLDTPAAGVEIAHHVAEVV